VQYGKFARTLTLPEGVEADKVKANYKDGVLQITMPAPKGLAAKKIQIEAK
jgi:HSP20 family protein